MVRQPRMSHAQQWWIVSGYVRRVLVATVMMTRA